MGRHRIGTSACFPLPASQRLHGGGDGDIMLETVGAGDTAVVILHGGGQSRAEWRPVAALLADALPVRVVSADLRGHGESDWSPSGSYALEDYVADLGALLAALHGPFVLVGHSHGAKVALCVAAVSDRHDVRGLVLVDAAPDMEPDWETNAMFQRTAEGFTSLEEAAVVIGGHFGKEMTPDGLARALVRAADGRYRWPWDPAVLDGIANGAVRDKQTLRRAARSIAVPALLLRTEESQFLDDHLVASFSALAPGLSVDTLPGTRHHQPWKRPGQLARALAEFVQLRVLSDLGPLPVRQQPHEPTGGVMQQFAYADHLEIHALLGRYAHAVDRQDFELARSCYHDDAFDDHGRYKGDVDGLISFFNQLGGTLESTFHMLSLPYIELVGDQAWVITYALYRRRSHGADEAVLQGLRYLDKLERRDGRWGVARRTVVLDWEHAVTAAPTIPSSVDWSRGGYGEDDPATAFLREVEAARTV